MLRKRPVAGSTTVAVTLSLLLVVFTVITFWLFWTRRWWFPESITAIGREIDAQFMRTLIITGIVFVASQLALAWVVFRYRDQGQRASNSHGNNTMEVLWTAATLILFVGLGVYAQRSWAEVHFRGAKPDAVQIEAQGQQFKWYFRYPGPDGKFGRTGTKFVDDSSGNFFGVDSDDPDGKDDLTTPIIAVPVNREVQLTLRSKDVIHSFTVRELRVKQDAVPGMRIPIHFTAEKSGRYEVACVELCGMNHHQMRSFLLVFDDAGYQNWLREQAAFSAQ